MLRNRHCAFRENRNALMTVQDLSPLGGILARKNLWRLPARSWIGIDGPRDKNARVVPGRDVRPSLIVLVHLLPVKTPICLGKTKPENVCRMRPSGKFSKGAARDEDGNTVGKTTRAVMTNVRIFIGLTRQR